MDKADKRPEMIVIAGPNGSGKTSVTKKFLHHEWADGVTYINPDQIAKDLFGDWNSKEAVLDAANYCKEWREKCLRDKIPFVFETVFSAQDKIDFNRLYGWSKFIIVVPRGRGEVIPYA